MPPELFGTEVGTSMDFSVPVTMQEQLVPGIGGADYTEGGSVCWGGYGGVGECAARLAAVGSRLWLFARTPLGKDFGVSLVGGAIQDSLNTSQ